MPFDGLTIRAIASELDATLKEARIDKIHQPEKDELVLSMRRYKSSPARLLISANARWARTHLSTEKKPNPTHPSSFCMFLRKHLEGGKIKEVKQLGMERIIHIRIEALDDFREWKDKILICEFMGRHSNIIMVNPENGIILDAIKKYGSDVSSFREVLPGKEYISPPDQGKLEPDLAKWEEFTHKMWQQEENNSLAAALFNTYTGISPYSARHICLNCGTDPDLPVGQCGEFEFNKVYYAIQSLLADIDQGKLSPVVLYDKSQLPLNFSPFMLSDNQAEVKVCASVNEACDTFFADKMNRLRLDSMKTSLTRKIKERLDRLYRKRFYQEGDLAKAYDHDVYKDWGELLTAYAHLYKKGDTEVTLNDFADGREVTLTLDPRYTPIQNAQRYFKIYNKSRGTRKHLQVLMAQNQQEIDYLESVLVAIQQVEEPAGLQEIIEELEKEGYLKSNAKKSKTREERSQPRRFISSEGLKITVGRNNRQNDWLTLKESDASDLWLHTKEIPGTHVILSLPPTVKSIHDVPDKSLEEAATLAAYYSKANQSEKVPVDYTFRYNVKKPGGAKPGMVIYDNYWTIMVNPCSPLVEELLSAQQTD